MKPKFFFTAILILLMTSAYSQTYKNETNSDDQKQLVEKELVSAQILTNLGVGTAQNDRNATLRGNSVVLSQIGDYNTAAINVVAQASEININQVGDQNYVGLDYKVKTAISEILQEGNRNTVYDIVNNRDADISLDIQQQGNDLNFQRLGVNKLTESLQFKQTEASPVLIIRSDSFGFVN